MLAPASAAANRRTLEMQGAMREKARRTDRHPKERRARKPSQEIDRS
jgi:hypothetical protein